MSAAAAMTLTHARNFFEIFLETKGLVYFKFSIFFVFEFLGRSNWFFGDFCRFFGALESARVA